MRNICFAFVVLCMLCAGGACTKKAKVADHYYKVGDTTFNGSYVQIGFSGVDYLEKDAAIPVRKRIVCIGNYRSNQLNMSSDSFYLHVDDTFGTYGLGGHSAIQYVATAITFRCGKNQTGTYKIGSGEINVYQPFTHYTADNAGLGTVNVFHNDTDFIQGTINCPFTSGGNTYLAAGSFKVYFDKLRY